MKKKISLVIVLLLVAGGVYWLAQKIKKDRTSAMNFEPVVRREIQQSAGPTTTTRTYTQKELEEARKKGQRLPGMDQPYIPPNQNGDAAVQRSLKTLEEVNRINEMNRRLMEQQQRNNRN